MLTSHMNLIYKAVKEVGIPIADLEAEVRENRFTIKIKNTPFQFNVFKDSRNQNDMAYSYTKLYGAYGANYISTVGQEKEFPIKLFDFFYRRRKIKIEDVCSVLKKWLISYRDNVKISNFWEQPQDFIPFISYSTFTPDDTAPFTPEEKEQARRSMDDFYRLLQANLKMTDEQRGFIKERLDYLTQALDRLNRFDWRGLAVSIVMGIALNLAVDTETGKLLFRLFEQAFHTTIRLLGG